MLTSDAIAAFLAAKTARGLAARTLETYRYRLNIFARCYPALPHLPAQIDVFLAQVGPTQETRETYYRLLRNLYRFLNRRELTTDNPVTGVDAPIVRPKVARSLTAEQLSILLMYPGHSEQLRSFLYLLADTGLRLSEALSIDNAAQVGLDTIIVSGKVGEREVPISPRVAAMVVDCLPWPWGSRDAAGLAVRRAFRCAGFTGRRASAHTLRHTFVRLWRGDESLLVGIMGWTSARMLQVYRPYDVHRAIAQHRIYSPITAAQESGVSQPWLLGLSPFQGGDRGSESHS